MDWCVGHRPCVIKERCRRHKLRLRALFWFESRLLRGPTVARGAQSHGLAGTACSHRPWARLLATRNNFVLVSARFLIGLWPGTCYLFFLSEFILIFSKGRRSLCFDGHPKKSHCCRCGGGRGRRREIGVRMGTANRLVGVGEAPWLLLRICW